MFHPDAYVNLIDKYKSYVVSPPLLLDLDIDPVTGDTFVKLNLQLVSHPHYGITKFRIRERYDPSGQLVEYRYCWEVNNRPTGNISAWENEPHTRPHGFPTDPHHHHHVPFDRHQVQASPIVRTLADAFAIVIPYIQSGRPYP
ncbi:MAG: toxin-antitoxin system TumE family protein [Tumebacillaceae bacterium]